MFTSNKTYPSWGEAIADVLWILILITGICFLFPFAPLMLIPEMGFWVALVWFVVTNSLWFGLMWGLFQLARYLEKVRLGEITPKNHNYTWGEALLLGVGRIVAVLGTLIIFLKPLRETAIKLYPQAESFVLALIGGISILIFVSLTTLAVRSKNKRNKN